MLLRPVVFYSGACAAPGRQHTAVIPQVAHENAAGTADLVPGKTRVRFLLLTPAPSAASLCRQLVVELEHSPEYEFGLPQAPSSLCRQRWLGRAC